MTVAFVNIQRFISKTEGFGVVLLLLLASCNITKRVENNQLLLVKNKIEVDGKLKKEIKKQLSNYYKQRPNDKFLGLLKTKLYFFNLGTGGKKDNGLKRFFRDKLGEAPVLVDTIYIESTIKSMKTVLRTKGHYYSAIDYKVIPNRWNTKKAKVTYIIKPGDYYIFTRYDLNIADKEIYDLVKPTMNNSLITIGYRFDQENILKEQERIVELLRNSGYYSFSKEFVDFDVDTGIGNFGVNMAMNIKNRNDYEAHKKYVINDITIEIDKNNVDSGSSASLNDTIPFSSFHYLPHKYELNPNILSHNLFLTRGEYFRQLNLTRTYGRLSDLNIFRFINITAKVIDTSETGLLDYYIKLKPSIKYNFVVEPQLITTDRSTLNVGQSYGVAATFQFANRNVFKNAEILQLSYRSSFEAQGKVSGGGIFNATEQSLTAAITVPHILFIPQLDQNINFINTKSTISTSAIYEINIEYERQVATTGLTYQFNKKLVSYYVAPIEFSFIRTTLKSPALLERAKSDIFLQNLFSNYVIMDSRWGFAFSNKSITKGRNYFFLKWDVLEYAGNTLTFMNQILNQERSSNGRFQLFNVNYFQYIKTAIDFRFNNIIDENNSFVYRIFSGIMMPYGNSPDYTPFEKRFFVGGANSLRAWSPRSIGPGSFVADNQIDHSGDVKIELNAEFRFNMYNQWLEGAIFTDAGNIWTLKKDGKREGAEFQFDRFYKELAADAGFGIRLNFSIVLIRFDLGIPLYNPTIQIQEDRMVIKDFNWTWLKDNLYFNFGIGYPF